MLRVQVFLQVVTPTCSCPTHVVGFEALAKVERSLGSGLSTKTVLLLPLIVNLMKDLIMKQNIFYFCMIEYAM
jgi:hypothetical protein